MAAPLQSVTLSLSKGTLTALAGALLIAGCAARAASGDPSETLAVGGVQRTYDLHVPANVPQNAPLVIAFHGHFGTGSGEARLSGLDALADSRGFIVAYPDGINRGWNDGRTRNANDGDDLAYAAALVDSLSKRYSIDPKRVYATGMSNGGTFSDYLACNEANRFAAIATVAAALPSVDLAGCKPQRAISVLSINGNADPIMPYNGGPIQLMGASRGDVLSPAKTAAFWAKNAGCSPTPASATLPPVTPADGTSVTRLTYGGCKDGASVVFYTIVGGGHTWPGGPQYLAKPLVGVASNQLDASATIVDFFYAHPMNR